MADPARGELRDRLTRTLGCGKPPQSMASLLSAERPDSPTSVGRILAHRRSVTPTILVVDDTDAVRELCADVLVSAGYRVLSAASADEALAELTRATEPVAAVLSDITMPHQSGADFARTLTVRWPNLRVLLMSGSELDAPVALPFLSKPFSPATLVGRVRELLGEADRA